MKPKAAPSGRRISTRAHKALSSMPDPLDRDDDSDSELETESDPVADENAAMKLLRQVITKIPPLNSTKKFLFLLDFL